MLEYPTIDYHLNVGEPCYAFDKMDGSNLRFCFRKGKFSKFGTRHGLFDKSHKDFGCAIDLFLNKYSNDLISIFKTKNYRNSPEIIVFAEFFGENSFAGVHKDEDKKEIVIFDVFANRKFVHPKQFINDFGAIDIAKLVYEGNFNQSFIDDVTENKFGLKEGCVVKGTKNGKLWMSKVKTREWYERLKNTKGEKALQDELKNIS